MRCTCSAAATYWGTWDAWRHACRTRECPRKQEALPSACAVPGPARRWVLTGYSGATVRLCSAGSAEGSVESDTPMCVRTCMHACSAGAVGGGGGACRPHKVQQGLEHHQQRCPAQHGSAPTLQPEAHRRAAGSARHAPHAPLTAAIHAAPGVSERAYAAVRVREGGRMGARWGVKGGAGSIGSTSRLWHGPSVPASWQRMAGGVATRRRCTI